MLCAEVIAISDAIRKAVPELNFCVPGWINIKGMMQECMVCFITVLSTGKMLPHKLLYT